MPRNEEFRNVQIFLYEAEEPQNLTSKPVTRGEFLLGISFGFDGVPIISDLHWGMFIVQLVSHDH